MEQIQARQEQIIGALQPVRPEVIYTAAMNTLEDIKLMQQWYASMPPGSAYYQHTHKRLPPTGGLPTQQQQEAGEQAKLDRELDRSGNAGRKPRS